MNNLVPTKIVLGVQGNLNWMLGYYIIRVSVGIEKSTPRDPHLSSLGKPSDAIRLSSGAIFSIPPSQS